jgi:hypothetical protein
VWGATVCRGLDFWGASVCGGLLAISAFGGLVCVRLLMAGLANNKRKRLSVP